MLAEEGDTLSANDIRGALVEAAEVFAHYTFINIHPFPDGNGRVGRFLMNALLVTSGFAWTVVRVSQRSAYFTALERASTAGDITALSTFLAREMVSGGHGEAMGARDSDASKSERVSADEQSGYDYQPAKAGVDPIVFDEVLADARRASASPTSDCVPPGC